jgi:hypothetical protein
LATCLNLHVFVRNLIDNYRWSVAKQRIDSLLLLYSILK